MGPLARFAALARERAIPNIDINFGDDDIKIRPSLARALARPGIVAEMKPASPTEGAIRSIDDPDALARALAAAGATAISALTEPTAFGGSPELLRAAARSGAPAIMKDFVVTARQLDHARACGASAVLLILPLLGARHSEWATPAEAIAAAHARGLESLVETYDADGAREAIASGADVVGINSRDLREESLPIDPRRSLDAVRAIAGESVPVLALSGVRGPDDARAMVRAGARGVLVGTSIMRASDPAAAVRALVEAIRE